MGDRYYLVREKAVPEVLLKVLEAKKKLQTGRITVQQATEEAGISRSSFYKYQNDIFPFRENVKGQTVTFILQMEDQPGILSDVLREIARGHGNILTIHQSIPISGVATLTISVEIAQEEGDADEMVGSIEAMEGVHEVKIVGKE